MAVTSPKQAKENVLESTGRSWTARPVLCSDFTDDIPLEDVYVGLLKQKKDTSTAIQSISTILPGFHHLKRCASNKLLLAPLNSPELLNGINDSSKERNLLEDGLKTLLKKGGFDLSILENDLQILKVPARGARTKTQAARASKVWPLNFHSDPSIERLIDGSIFTEHQLNMIEGYMNVAVKAARLGAVGNTNCNGSAVIVDPGDGRILAIAASKIDMHPMWHSAMIAVDLVATLQGGGAWKLEHKSAQNTGESVISDNTADEGDIEAYSTREKRIKRKYIEEAPLYFPEELSTIHLPKGESFKSTRVVGGRKNNGPTKSMDSHSSEECGSSNSEKCLPYLCTGYWTFLLREPCPLCAMALLHSRVSRIFYGTSNQNTGVLGSKTILHAVPGLNHRYLVWSGVLEEDCRQVLEEIENKNLG